MAHGSALDDSLGKIFKTLANFDYERSAKTSERSSLNP